MPLKFKELQKILKDFWYKLDHQRWSHQTYSFGDKMITVPRHKELKAWTAQSILQDIVFQQWLDIKKLKWDYNIKI